MDQYHAAPPLPSRQECARLLGGHVRADGCVAFPMPGGNPKNFCCTLKLEGPDGFIVADASGRIEHLALKDQVRKRLGLPPFQRAPEGRLNGVARATTEILEDGSSAKTKPSRIHLIRFSDIQLSTQRRDVVQGLIPRDGITVVWGPPKCGKSFWMLDLMMNVALGRDYRGRRVIRGPVVLCAFEGQMGTQTRIEAFRQRHMSEDCAPEEVPFALMPVTIDLVAEQNDLIASIRGTLGQNKPVMVVLDTLNRSLAGSESNDADMSAYVRAADAVREALSCAVVIVHHCGHDNKRPRGHTSLIGAADAVIAVRKDKATGIVVAELEMMKDGEAGAALASRLDRIEVGQDDDKVVIASCVVTPIDGPLPPTSKKGPKLTAAAQIAYEALKEALAEAGDVPPASSYIPGKTKTVRLSLWRRYFYQRDPDSSPDARKQAFRRYRQTLQQLGLVQIWGAESCSDEDCHCWIVE